MDTNTKNTKSETQKMIDEFFDKVKDIVIKTGDKKNALKQIENLKSVYPDMAGNLSDVFDFATKSIEDGMNTPDELGKCLDKLDDMKAEKTKNIESTFDAANQQAVHNSAISEIVNETGFPPAQIEEALQDEENNVDINDIEEAEELENVGNGPYALKRPDKERVKQLYKYKVEGKITSGIKDLDNFLGLIQPAINQLIIAAWKPIFGIADAGKLAGENFERWQKRNQDLSDGWKFLQSRGIIPKDKPFRWAQNIEEKENEMAGYFNAYMCNQMNASIQKDNAEYLKDKEQVFYESRLKETNDENIARSFAQKDMEDYKKSKEYQDYMKTDGAYRTDLFDESKPPRWSRTIIDKELLKCISRDDKNKLTEDSKKAMKGYSIVLDLFNKKNSDDFYENYFLDIDPLMKKAKDPIYTDDDKIENIDIEQFMKQRDDDEKEERKQRKIAGYYNFGNGR